MLRSLTTLARLFAALALAMAVFVITPVADASACAPEPASAHQILDHPPVNGDLGSGDVDGLCVHGHCHHTSSERHSAGGHSPALQSYQMQYALPADDSLIAHSPNGLKRPPRG